MNWLFERAYEWLAARKRRELSSESYDWMTEHRFWATKSSRAHIRFEMALKNKDYTTMEIALKQQELYSKRMRAVVPPKIRAEWDKGRAITEARERRAAIEEIQ